MSKYSSKWDKHWEEQTFGAWWLPNQKYIPNNNLEKNSNATSIRYCKECDSVYDKVWSNGRYKLYIWEDFPKTQKEKICPSCEGKKDCKVMSEE
jgi:hypothetical protein